MDIPIPFTILSYGDYSTFKRLFSYERHGVHTLPVFTDLAKAALFAGDMMTLMKTEFDDHRKLVPNICPDRHKAIKMFETIAVHIRDLSQIIINPSISMLDDECLDTLRHTPLVEDTYGMADWLYYLKEETSSNTE